VLGADPKHIILYGQSLGTGPTLHLARQFEVQAVVLHSGIMSGLRVIRPYMKSTYWFDIFPNIDAIRDCRSPVFVIHGTHDEEIGIEHGKRLYENARGKLEPWWVEGGGHNDIEFETRALYFKKLENLVRETGGFGSVQGGDMPVISQQPLQPQLHPSEDRKQVSRGNAKRS